MSKGKSKNKKKNRTYHSGREVFETFIPGYVPPDPSSAEPEEEVIRRSSPEAVKTALLKDLQKKLDDLEIGAGKSK
jgi:hypothetical protein